MEIIEVSSEEYHKYIGQSYHVFNTAVFNKFNKERCENVHYLLFKDSKVRAGIILGVKDNTLYSPFSAPFGGFSFIKNDIRIQQLDQAIIELKKWSTIKGYAAIQITLPPSIYGESFISKQLNSFYRNKFEISKIDLNYAIDLSNFSDDYEDSIWRNARKNLKASSKNNFLFKKCETSGDKKKAYQIIKKNREERGYPLRMTWEQVEKTIKNIKADFFILALDAQKLLASAMVFHISPNIVQVIYWGDIPEFSHLKTMNFLSYKLFEYYKGLQIDVVDIGPSTENSVPNYGLCEFKESIGCDISPKFTLSFTS